MALDTTSYLLGKKSGGSGGTTNYSDLSNKPQINNTELSGNKSSSDLGLQDELVSGTNIKTINNTSLLGEGDIQISSGSSEQYIIETENKWNDTISSSANIQVLQDIYDKWKDDGEIVLGNILYHIQPDPTDSAKSYIVATNCFITDYYMTIAFKDISGDANTSSYGGYYYLEKNYIIRSFISNDTVGNTTVSKFEEYTNTSNKNDFPLSTNNTSSYTPTGDYNPATKKYVDDRNTYSSSEIVIGKWIDNKPLYRQVFSFEVDSITTNYITGINNMGTLVTIRGITLQPEIHPLPHAATSYNYQQTIAYIKEDKKIQVKSGSGVTLPYDVYAILEYTKTTD